MAITGSHSALEFDVEEVITSNVLGTQIVLEAADMADAFGATKRLAELLVADTTRRLERPSLTARLGNLADSL